MSKQTDWSVYTDMEIAHARQASLELVETEVGLLGDLLRVLRDSWGDQEGLRDAVRTAHKNIGVDIEELLIRDAEHRRRRFIPAPNGDG